MALKAAHVSGVPSLDHVPEVPAISLSSPRLPPGVVKAGQKPTKFLVVGHRGKGMNALASPDRRMKEIKENSILSFNAAGRFPIDLVEFDVQVTKDDCPIIFHDDLIHTEEDGKIIEKRTTDLTLEEFLSYGPQKDRSKAGKPLIRKTKDGRFLNWNVESDYPLCTLQEAFELVDSRIGFNIELKLDDYYEYRDEELTHTLQAVLRVVLKYAKERPIIFSSFQPDAPRLMAKLQSSYPVYFLTNGGTQSYPDVRRNSLEEALKLCIENGLQGIVSEVKAIFRCPPAIHKIKEANLTLLTYGVLNNVPEAVYMQHVLGINGVIVDLVQEITESLAEFITHKTEEENGEENGKAKEVINRPNFSQKEISFLLRLIPELVQ
ncbi:glycerophosphodiester phosphodiesterase gde1-like protein [Carex littledalei]|uniref:glycerophosphodiester phosphodiesterase n=1 Tax=Carex littledalei TaxID=544730 RepID=A0A833QJ98_9POAL|nr:glycerophosphodiester phosphodiesterase gde1-like protein [Carex littledalei]